MRERDRESEREREREREMKREEKRRDGKFHVVPCCLCSIFWNSPCCIDILTHSGVGPVPSLHPPPSRFYIYCGSGSPILPSGSEVPDSFRFARTFLALALMEPESQAPPSHTSWGYWYPDHDLKHRVVPAPHTHIHVCL